MCSTLNWDTFPPFHQQRGGGGGMEAGSPRVVSTFGLFFCFVFFLAKPRRTVRESYHGLHFRDFVVVVVIFSKTASMRGPFHFSRWRASRPKQCFCDCNQRRQTSRAIYPPACAAHALSCMSALLLCFPIIFIYLQYLYQCVSCSLLLFFFSFFFNMNHTNNTKES